MTSLQLRNVAGDFLECDMVLFQFCLAERAKVGVDHIGIGLGFDRTGTTKIGKYVLNHSFMMPGIVSTVVAIVLGLLFIQIY